jgi:GMP synthase (glutamine-hydrolysing)
MQVVYYSSNPAIEISMKNPFLLLQSRDALDPMRAHEVECFAASLGIPKSSIAVVDMLQRVPTREELATCGAVLTGGSGDYSSLDPFPWIHRMIGYVRETLLPSGVPTFASCFGLQVTTLALGGEMMRDPANREVGSVDLTLTPAAATDPLFSPLPSSFVGQAGHTDRAAATPPGATLLASSALCPVNAFRVEGKPFWCTQFHPELDPDAVARRYIAYMEKYPPPDLPPGTPLADAPFLKRLRPSPHATRLLQRFAQWCRVHGPVTGAV